MRMAYTLGGGAPCIKKYQVAASSATVGVPKLIPAAGGAGVAVATTTSATDMVGITLDRKSTRLNSSHIQKSRMPSSA